MSTNCTPPVLTSYAPFGMTINGIRCEDYGNEYGLFRVLSSDPDDTHVLGYWKTIQRVNQTAKRYGVKYRGRDGR